MLASATSEVAKVIQTRLDLVFFVFFRGRRSARQWERIQSEGVLACQAGRMTGEAGDWSEPESANVAWTLR